MALVVEDGSIVSGADAYVSLADCDSYHSDRGNTAWTGEDSAKEQAIRRATQFIEGAYRGRWTGSKRDPDQSLAWPRIDAYDEDNYLLSSIAVPGVVVNATCEAALREIESANSLSPDLSRGGQIKHEQIGPISVTYTDGATPLTVYTAIDRLLSGLVRSRLNAVLLRA